MAKNSGATKTRSKGDNLLPISRRPVLGPGGSVYARLREELRASVVETGQPGERVPSERELARQFGVSPLTVSRAMQELQSEGAVERIVGKGTFISQKPRAEAKQARGNEALEAPDAWEWRAPAKTAQLETPYVWIVASLGGADDEPQAREYWSHRLASHLERWTQKCGGRTVVTNQESVAAQDIAALAQAMVAQGVNSVIFLFDGPAEGTRLWMHQLLRLQEKSAPGLRVTQVSFGNSNRFPLDTVRFNGEQGAFLAPGPSTPWIADRIAGFERALEMAGLEVGPDRAFYAAPAPTGRDTWSFAGRDAGARLLDATRFSAVVAANDAMAKAFLELASERGLKVPDDVSVVGFDDWRYSSTLGLTTVHPPIELMGEVAASLTLKRLSQPFDQGHVEVVLDPTLVVRSSTRAFN